MDWQAHEAMFADNVTNTGRAATTVNAVQTHFDSKPASSINAAPDRGKDLPYRLEPNHQEAWLLSADDLTGYVLDLHRGFTAEIVVPTKMTMSVNLGNGTTVDARGSVRWADLVAWARGRPTPDEFRNLGVY